MKHPKRKKKRSRPSKPTEKDVAGEEHKDHNVLIESFSLTSIGEPSTAYREANCDVNKAVETRGRLLKNSDAQSAISSTTDDRSAISSTTDDRSAISSTTYYPSTSSVTDSSSSEGLMEKYAVRGKGFREGKAKKVVAVTGTVSTVLGKDYVRLNPKRDSMKLKGFDNRRVDIKEAEQFLCSMLGDECDLGMAVVKDVLCNCGFNVEQALHALLALSASSHELSRDGISNDYCTYSDEDTRFHQYGNFTDRASDSTSHSSEGDLQDIVQCMGFGIRNYSSVLTSSEACVPSSPGRTKSNLPQKVLDSLFKVSKSSEHEPHTMNWRNVVKKMHSLGQRFDHCPSGTNEHLQSNLAEGDEYQVCRKAANQNWDLRKSYYQRAATAYSSGQREYAAYLSEQGKWQTKRAQEADEKASRQIFEARNRRIENVLTIDLHGQHVDQAIKLLKLHLLFGTYVSSVQILRVITGCGSHGVGKSKLKQAVVKLLEREGIKWSEENQGTVLIKLDGQREFSFLDYDSETE